MKFYIYIQYLHPTFPNLSFAVETPDGISAHAHCANTNQVTHLSLQSSIIFSLLPGGQIPAHEQQAAVCIYIMSCSEEEESFLLLLYIND